MGAKIFVKDGVFYPADYGLEVGDVVDLVVVGGGNKATRSSDTVIRGGDSSFGEYVKAIGGGGSPGAIATCDQIGSGGTYNLIAAGGGGGYVPASGKQGGGGLSSYPGLNCVYAPGTNAGGADASVVNGNYVYSTGIAKVVAGAGANAGGGSGVAAINGRGFSCGYGGDGYGAGGGASSVNNTKCFSGNAGQIVYESHKITEEDCTNGIPVTVGKGGSSLRDYLHCIDLKTGKEVPLGDAPGGPLGTFADDRIKTNDLLDGTRGFVAGMSASSGPNNVGTTYVQFPGDDTYHHVNGGRFIGFNATWTNNPVYYCNGYYVQAEYTGQTTYKLNWVRADVARERTPVSGEYGYVNFNLGRQFALIGFSETDLVVTQEANRVYVIENWTPESPTTVSGAGVKSVTLNASIITYAGDNSHIYSLHPYKGDGNMIVIRNVGSGVSTSAGSYNAVFNYKTGEVTALPYVPCGAYFIHGTDCFSLRLHTVGYTGNTQQTWSAGPVTEPYYEMYSGSSNWNYVHADYAWRQCYRVADGSGDCVTFNTIRGGDNDKWAGVKAIVVPGTNDTVFYFDGVVKSAWTAATDNKTFTAFGYDNNPGEDGEGTITDVGHYQGGGAGGCVAVYW